MLMKLRTSLKEAYRGWPVASRLERVSNWLEIRKAANGDGRSYDHTETVNDYYSLCSEIMQVGWNESLHFAPLRPGESVEESIVRLQRLMIAKLELEAGMTVIDVGCGVGGPMRRVARESGARVVCLNNNEQQLQQARRKNIEAGLDHLAQYERCNFMDMSRFEADSFDAAYAIESTCHAPDKQGAFAEIFRVLKPGALFWGQEMCLTNAYDPGRARHRAIKEELMRGIALDDIATFAEVNRALEAVGFDVVEAMDRDVQEGPSTPWYQPMEDRSGTVRNALLRTPFGRSAMVGGLKLAEALRIVPKGSCGVAQLLHRTAHAYVAGGKAGIFTPLYCFLARKPDANGQSRNLSSSAATPAAKSGMENR